MLREQKPQLSGNLWPSLFEEQSTFLHDRSQKCRLFQFNFVGKLLGPKGNSMKRLQEDTMTKMAVLGRGSMRNKQQVRNYLICGIVCQFQQKFGIRIHV